MSNPRLKSGLKKRKLSDGSSIEEILAALEAMIKYRKRKHLRVIK